MSRLFRERTPAAKTQSPNLTMPGRTASPQGPIDSTVLHFERSLGNQAVQRTLQSETAKADQIKTQDEFLQINETGRMSSPTIQREERPATGGASSPIVYLCAKDLDTSPVGRHAFFRIGAPGTGNPTLSLQPIDSSLGADCWQGIPAWNYASDVNADADCDVTSISLSDLQREFRAYPIGHYCTWGPNSNTFVGVVARNCGMRDPDPSGWTPGIDDGPPPSGTYAPDKWTTLRGCETKQCVIGPDDPGNDLRRA